MEGIFAAKIAVNMPVWIHQLEEWPNLIWDGAALSAKLADVRNRMGRLQGRAEALGFDLRREATLNTLTTDIVRSWAIEGETLNLEEVRSSISRRLGFAASLSGSANRDVEGGVEMTLDAVQRYDEPLTADRLFGWHAALFPAGYSGLRRIAVGAQRPESAGRMQVVSGPPGREKVHFEAPEATRLKGEMSAFLAWFENPGKIDPVLHAGLAHLRFVTIHPFEDGNGRIARAIADMALSRADGSRERHYGMSTQIEAERDAYYRELELQQRGGTDATPWLEWFLDCLGRAVDGAEDALAAVLHKARVWKLANRRSVNGRQRLALNRMLDGWRGGMTSSRYAKLAKCSADTALRDIQDLVDGGVLIRNPAGGRSTNYRIASPEELDALTATGG